jgi:hypothetical protein
LDAFSVSSGRRFGARKEGFPRRLHLSPADLGDDATVRLDEAKGPEKVL